MVAVVTLGVGFANGAFTGFPKGYDAFGHMSKIKFLVDYFPNADWNYEWYSGQYFSEASFPPLFHYLGAVLVGWFGFSSGGALIAIAAASFVTIGCGLYGFVRAAGGGRVAGLVAAFLLVASSAYWAYMVETGLYPRILGMAFLSLFAFFAVLYFTRRSTALLVAAVLSLAATLSSHLLLGAVGIALAILLVAVQPISLGQRLVEAVKVLVPAGSLVAYFYLPYVEALSRQAPAPLPTFTRDYSPLSPGDLFPPGTESLPVFLLPLAVIATILAFRQPRPGASALMVRVMIVAAVAGAAALVYALVGFPAPHVFIYAIQPGQAPFFAAWFLAALSGLALSRSAIRAEISATLLVALLAVIAVTAPQPAPGTFSGDNQAKRAVQAALVLDPAEHDYRVGVNWDGGSDWIDSRANVPQTRGYQQQGVLRADWQYWLEHAVWSADSNYAEANFLLDWYAVRSLYGGPDPDVVRRFEARPDLYRPLSTGSPDFARTFEYSAATPVLSAGDTRTALVIGGDTAYSLVLRAIALSDFDSRSLIPIRGGEYLDDHSIAELSRFDEVILYQYRVHDPVRALALLDRYVERGGSAFVEASGSDLEQARPAAPPIPGAAIMRTGIGPAWDLERGSSPIAAGLDLTGFSPATYAGGPWGISYIPESSIASWAAPVLLTHGYPVLVAGTLGRGRVVWSGMNLPYHASSTRNAVESQLLAQALAWAAPAGGAPAEYKASFVNPQERSIRLEGPAKGVLFKESWVANWRAAVDGHDVEIYRAGPDFMYIPLHGLSQRTLVTLSFTRTALEWTGDGVSLLALGGLLLYWVAASRRRFRRRRDLSEAVRASD